MVKATRPIPSHKPDDPKQSARFIETAKKLEVDETEEGAEKAFRRIVRPTKKPSNP